MLTAPSPFLIGKPRLFELLYQAPPFDAYINATNAPVRCLLKPSNGWPFAARLLRVAVASNVSGMNVALDSAGASGFGGIYVAKWDTTPNGESALPANSSGRGPDALFTTGSSIPGDNPVQLKFNGDTHLLLAAGQVARSDAFSFHLAQGDGLVIQFSGLLAATFGGRPTARTYTMLANQLGTIFPGGTGQVTSTVYTDIGSAGILSIEGMR